MGILNQTSLYFLKSIPIKRVRKKAKIKLRYLKNKKLQALNNLISTKFHEGNCVIYCSASMGDVFFLCGFIPEIERQKHVKIFPVFRQSHAFIASLFGIKEFAVVNQWDDVLYLPVCWEKYGVLTSLYEIGKKNPEIRAANLFIAQPPLLNFDDPKNIFPPHPFGLNSPQYHFTNENLMAYTKKYLGIRTHSVWQAPKIEQTPSPSFIKRIPNPKKVVLICPEHSARKIDFGVPFWEKIVQKWREKGFTVIQNTINPDAVIRGAIWVSMSAAELYWLGSHCHHVISVRSGICDLLYRRGKNLTVVYPNVLFYKTTNLSDIFGKSYHDIILE